jgi:hypothetical protein
MRMDGLLCYGRQGKELMQPGRGLSPLEAASKINVGNVPTRPEALPPEPIFADQQQANLAEGGAYIGSSARCKIKAGQNGKDR